MKIKSMIMALAVVGALYSLPDEPVQAGHEYGGEGEHCHAVMRWDWIGLRGAVFQWMYRTGVLALFVTPGWVILPDCAVDTEAFDARIVN